MRKRCLFLISAFVFLSGFFAFQMPVFAQTNSVCSCFCATEAGAKKLSETKVAADVCTDECKKQGNTVAVCAQSLREYPANSTLCFDTETCTAQKGVLADYQAPNCPTGWTYCFPTAEQSTLTLNTKIGNLETVGDLGTYVSALYKWMLGAAFLFAIVMTMIGGLQYAIGAAAKDQIAKAKKRITDGVTGLVLLLCVVLIGQIVNPQILNLQIPRPSKLREVNLNDSSCELFKKAGWTLSLVEGTEECGGLAELKVKPDGSPAEDGLTCNYTKCNTGTCVATLQNPGGQCVLCHEVSLNNPASPAVPSQAMCSKLGVIKPDVIATWNFSSGTAGLKSVTGQEVICQYQPGGITNLYSGAQSTTVTALSDDSCFEVALDCNDIDECVDYNVIPVSYWDGGELKTKKIANVLPNTLKGMCVIDGCNVGGDDRCEYTENDVVPCDD